MARIARMNKESRARRIRVIRVIGDSKNSLVPAEGRAAPSADMSFPLWASGMVLPPPATGYRLPATDSRLCLLTCLRLSPTISFTTLSVTALEAER